MGLFFRTYLDIAGYRMADELTKMIPSQGNWNSNALTTETGIWSNCWQEKLVVAFVRVVKCYHFLNNDVYAMQTRITFRQNSLPSPSIINHRAVERMANVSSARFCTTQQATCHVKISRLPVLSAQVQVIY